MRTAAYLVVRCLLAVPVILLAAPGRAQERTVSSAPATRPAEARQDALAAEQILDRVARTYAGCKSYSDKGLVRTKYISTAQTWVEDKPFTTAFVRPDRFRFEFRSRFPMPGSPEHRYIVWRNGQDVRKWWDVEPGITKPESFELAVAGATGVSGGSAHTVPRLLLPQEIRGIRVTDLGQAKRVRVEDGDCNGIACHRIEGTCFGSPLVLWVDKKSFLLRRIDTQTALDKGRAETTTTYEPEVDGQVSDEMLGFNAPGQE